MNNIYNKLITETNIALSENEVPVGCVIVKEGNILSSSHNQRIKLNDPLAHAEIIAIKKAAKKIKSWNLVGCEMYVTLKPCKMCQEIINESRIKKVFYIVDSSKEINQNTEYIELLKIDDPYGFKTKIVNFFKEKR